MYTINHVLHVIGRGWIFACEVPGNMPVAAGHQIAIVGTDEVYTVASTERAMLLVHPPRPSTRIGILIKGELAQDHNAYIGRQLASVPVSY